MSADRRLVLTMLIYFPDIVQLLHLEHAISVVSSAHLAENTSKLLKIYVNSFSGFPFNCDVHFAFVVSKETDVLFSVRASSSSSVSLSHAYMHTNG